MSAIPQVPPRPTRSHHQQSPTHDIPTIPPRPNRRKSDRSQSPNPEHFPRSPFNEPPISKTISNSGGGLTASSRNTSSTNLPKRPSSVSLPSLGQEGNEYADIDYEEAEEAVVEETSHNEPRETRNVAGDLPLHAPKPSFSKSTAKERVSTVTRTDSTQAAAVGIGKAPTPTGTTDDTDHGDHTSRAKVSFRTASAASTERPDSAFQTDEEHGIPEIGQRVPMYPDAGDVQAPSPSPFQQQFPVGIGFHNSGAAKPGRHHRRTPSGRELLPPGSYGMHGHGVQAADHFERDWYAKHPDALQREEHGEYGPGIGGGRGEWALSSDDLNKLVYETSRNAPETSGIPPEQLGYQASEEYSHRVSSPPSATLKLIHSNSSQPHVESPLRKSSFPVEPDAGAVLQKTRSYGRSNRSSDNALDSETETEDEGIRLAPPAYRTSKYTGSGYDPPTEELGPHGGNTEDEGGFIEERGYGVPILASDEVAKTPGAEYMQPAVSPAQERRGSGYLSAVEGGGEYMSGFKTGSRSGSAANSRPSSRPGSIHSITGLSRFTTHEDDRDLHTPLEDVDEYEPLFPDEDGNKQRKPMTAAERLKLREQMKRFPSQDIWEDTPNSLQLQATVDTPEAVAALAEPSKKAAANTFETAEQEAARKGEPSERERAKLLPGQERLAKSQFQPHLREEMERPNMKQRFPSRDIWEDSPDSANLETVVGERQTAELGKSPTDIGLEAGAVVQTSGRSREGVISGEQARDNATSGAPSVEKPSIPPRPNKYKVPPAFNDSTWGTSGPPSIPARPTKKTYQVPPADAQATIAPSNIPKDVKSFSPTESSKGSVLPDRPKPQIPARPAKPAGQEPSETAPLTKMTSASSIGSDDQSNREALAPKSKPAIPARPTGSKIANLKAGFLGDLESRLKLGPQGPKSQEKEKPEPDVEEEKIPLADARKGRAKGPAKRKPPTVTIAETTGAGSRAKWQIHEPWTTWETEEDGNIVIPTKTPSTSTEGSVIAKTREASAGRDNSFPLAADTDTDTTSPDIHKADVPPKGSIQVNDSLSQADPDTPGNTDLATPAFEKERNPLSKEPPTPISSPPSTVISPDPLNKEDPVTETEPPKSQIQESVTVDTSAASIGDTELSPKTT